MKNQTLDKMDRHEGGEIVHVDGDNARVQRLMALGFLPGGKIRVVQIAPFGDPIAVELDGWRVSLRRSEAALVTVAPNGNGKH